MNKPNAKAIPNAATASSRPTLTVRVVRPETLDGPGPAFPSRVGRSATKRVAIVIASERVQTLLGMPEMARARLLMASSSGKPASFPASFHGSSRFGAALTGRSGKTAEFASAASSETKARLILVHLPQVATP